MLSTIAYRGGTALQGVIEEIQQKSLCWKQGIMEGARERCFQAGMDDYVTKPISRDVLSATIVNLVQKK
jgi:CheY-like chemotaxis protein